MAKIAIVVCLLSAVSAAPAPEADAEAYYIPYYAVSSSFTSRPNSNANFVSKFSNSRSNFPRDSQHQHPFNNFNQESAYNQREFNQQPFNNFNQESAYNQREFNQQAFNNFNQQSAYNPKEYNKQTGSDFDQDQIKDMFKNLLNTMINLKVEDYSNKQPSYNNGNQQSAFKPKEYNQ